MRQHPHALPGYTSRERRAAMPDIGVPPQFTAVVNDKRRSRVLKPTRVSAVGYTLKHCSNAPTDGYARDANEPFFEERYLRNELLRKRRGRQFRHPLAPKAELKEAIVSQHLTHYKPSLPLLCLPLSPSYELLTVYKAYYP